ncbi:protein phosphatase 2C homolog 7, mitochondrial [[Candida] jaroonii]|uniref:Protein phosphatase 2C homolog 7, mitochondrial n=1 Tax=[Candida] jaroonii TaxID=467808 RepID=A0ACA9Y8U9_9ASCO|nr:protein phosphatase 2C homolog 7, mitochondrial [[Candida] jaroonii]
MFLSFISKRTIKYTVNNVSFKPYSQTVKGTVRSFSNSSNNWWSQSKNSTTLNVANDYLSKDYNIAFAYEPKDREESNKFKTKKPSAALTSPTGEDNLFISKNVNGNIALGVADGVGGWSEAGYDSSAISRELCLTIKEEFENNSEMSPKELLINAFEKILKSPKVEIGGTTSCFGVLTNDKKLKVVNLGDSWCGVFRDFSIVHETKFQTHNFNTPYQLAKIPIQIIKQAQLSGKRYIIDKPEMGDEYQWDLQKNDIIMFATDGVTDNVVPEDIGNFLKDSLSKGELLPDISKNLVSQVVKLSKNPEFPSNFAQELSKLTGQKYLGGKEDDITIVLVQVN